MPRDGAHIYNLPFPDVSPSTTIESTVYNGFTHDVAQDLNAPRPLVAGGTGATNSDDALANLNGEKEGQVVTNFDSMVWVSGSFSAASTATAAPVAGHAFSGIVYVTDSDNIVVEARDTTDGKLYVRRKVASVWGAWVVQAGAFADLDAAYVNVGGDTMTGQLTVNAGITSVATATTGTYYFGNSGTKYLTYDGAIFNLGGGDLYCPQIVSSGNVWSRTSSTTGSFYFGSSGTKYLNYDGTNFTLNGGTLFLAGGQTIAVGGDVVAGQANTVSGTYRFGNNGTKYLTCDATNYTFASGGLVVNGAISTGNIAGGGTITAASSIIAGGDITTTNGSLRAQAPNASANMHTWYLTETTAAAFITYYERTSGHFYLSNNLTGRQWVCKNDGNFQAPQGYVCKQGYSGAYGPNGFNMYYAGGPCQLWIDATNLGNIQVISDYRIKKDVLDLPGMWDTVKALRPIKYTQAEFTPPAQLEVNEERRKAGEEVSTAPMFPANDIEQWGFIAHELQETMLPTASTGVKDSPDHVQSPNPMPLIAALTKALQEAMARIEVLEAR